MSWRLYALPGRVLLKFPPPEEKTRSGIIIPERSRRLAEIGTVVDIGEPLNDDHDAIVAAIQPGDLLPITYGAGTEYYFGDNEEFAHLNGIRAFTISELGSALRKDGE